MFRELIKGIIVGSMAWKWKEQHIQQGKDAVAIVKMALEHNIPVIYNFPAGHIRDVIARINLKEAS
jgi:muramoyltetrapeptide carboxypeptidase